MKGKFGNSKLKIVAFITLFIALIVIATITLHPSFSEKTTTSIWDGSIATEFSSGTGTLDDPFIINNGSELAYMFNLINGEESSTYFNKYYTLNNNINMNNIDFSYINSNKTFSGTLDGNGYTLSNILLNNGSINDISNTLDYALFENLYNATIKNINFNISNINTDSTTNNVNASLLSITASGSTIENVSFNNVNINCNNINSNFTSGIITNDLGNNNLNNLHVSVTTNSLTSGLIFYDYDNSIVNNVIYLDNGLSFDYNSELNLNELSYGYHKNNDIITFNNNYSTNTIIEKLNTSSSLEWTYDDNIFRLRNNGTNRVLLGANVPTNITPHDSGVAGNTIYVNDFDADYDYYMGLNYTTSDNRNIPTRVSKNIYGDSNLAYVQLNYNGEDYAHYLNNSNGYVGYVSLSEQYDRYVYYKVYEVNNNNTVSDLSDDYIEIELIDNPWADRPNNMAFNGWVSTLNIDVMLNEDIYVRTIRVPITYSGGKPNGLVLDFYSSWVKATTYSINSNTWTNALNAMQNPGFQKANSHDEYWDIDEYYYTATVARYSRYTDGDWYSSRISNQNVYTESDGSQTCNTNGGCTVYRPALGTTYSNTRTYYSITLGSITSGGGAFGGGTTYTTGTFTRVTPQYVTENIENLAIGDSAAGFYRAVTILNGGSIAGYYDETGSIVTSGRCNRTGGCTYYEYIHATDSSGNPEVAISGVDYYYMVTRDTNIIFLTGNVTGTWSSQTKPFTFTGINNGVNNTTRYRWTPNNGNTAFLIGADTRIEMMTINSNAAITGNTTYTPASANSIYANFNNLKIGRGIRAYVNNNTTYATFASVCGGSNSFSGNDVKRSTLIIESGTYNGLGLISTNSSSGTVYADIRGTYGNDLDRVLNQNNNLIVRYCASGTWAGNIYGENNNAIALTTIVKSGTIGQNKYDYAAGLYVGGRNGGNLYTTRKAIIEGGYIYNLIGGPLSVESFDKSGSTYLNDTYIYVKGGSVDVIIGGAGVSPTYGNRVIQVSGGTINYAVFGGSNGVSATDTGKLNGDTYVYVGGHSIIGSETAYNAYVSNGTKENISKVEPGSVFGAGNGTSGDETIGAVNNSYIVIDGEETLIRNNVYGGGNYGAVGYNSNTTYSPCYSEINIYGGTIDGSVYGGGNNNGSGQYSHNVTSGRTTTTYYDVPSNITIKMYDGTVNTGIYGGSNVKGTVYGSTSVNVYGGNAHDVYGGGEGADTYVRDNVAVVIGDTTPAEPVITGNVYGGSAFGTVNATAKNAAANNKTTTVTVNNGNITGTTIDGVTTGGSVFGGAKGDANNIPYVKGKITVTINDGTINKVFGGFDEAGKPEAVDITSGGGSDPGTEPETPGDSTGTKYWVKITGAADITTDDVYMIVNSTNNSAMSYSGSAISGTSINVTEKGIQDGRTYYEITGADADEKAQWLFGTNGTIGTIRNNSDNTKYLRLTTYYADNLVAVGNASTNIALQAGTNDMWQVVRRSEAGSTSTYYISYTNNNFSIQTNNTNANLNIYKQITVEQSTTKERWVPINGTNEITTSDVYMIVNSANNAAFTYSGSAYAKASVTVTADGTDNGRTYYDIAGIDENSQWTFGTNSTIGTIRNVGDPTKYVRLTTYYTDNIVASGNASTDIAIESTGNNMWHIIRYGRNGDYYIVYTNNNFAAQIGDSNGELRIYKKIVVTIEEEEPEEPDIPDEPDTPDVPDAPSIIEDIAGNDYVYLKGGIIGDAFGGGNNTSIDVTHIYLQGAEVTNLYGGSNNAGDVVVTYVNIESGESENVFGGNNLGGTCEITNVLMTGGEITNSLYGGGNQVETDTTKVVINNGNIGNVFGGGNAAGITTETNVTINTGTITIDNLYGGSNQSGNVPITNMLVNSGDITNIYGGNNAGGNVTNSQIVINNVTSENVFGGNNANGNTTTSNVIINNGDIDNAYGGNNLGGTTTNTNLTINNGTVDYVYGGGYSTNATSTNVVLNGGIIITGYGGSNNSGQIGISDGTNVTGGTNINITNTNNITITDVYGGNNAGGNSLKTNVVIDSGTITNVYGGGNNAVSGDTNVLIKDGNITTLYGGGNNAASANTIVHIESGTITDVYGGGNQGATTDTTITIDSGSMSNVYGGGNRADANDTTLTINNGTINNLYGGGNQATAHDTDITVNNGTINNLYGGGNQASVHDTDVLINNGTFINAYGGGNEASCNSTDLIIADGSFTNVYGGGNAAGVSTNTSLKVDNADISVNLYGGGNEGTVGGNTNVLINDTNILGSAYAGGNGSTAVVYGNTTITVGGDTVVGSASGSVPATGSVFAGGNAAATGIETFNNSVATLNIAGGTFYGNVYGGPNTSKIYGITDVNIGNGVTLVEGIDKSGIDIRGTVFGGGEANASGSETFDWSFISVTNGITVNIDALGYDTFNIDGSIFGSGNASETSGTSTINIKNYGSYKTPEDNISIQRTNILTLDNSSILLHGASDRTNDYSDVLFGLSKVTRLDMTNNSTLYLENGTNLLEEYNSKVTSDGAYETVSIDEATGELTTNVENRIYIYAGRNINIAKNESVTQYGNVNGMSFFGMYTYNQDGTPKLGMYDTDYETGDALNWGDLPDKGSYVLGLHKSNHDINVDGFYSNFMDQETGKNEIKIIEPTPDAADFYMWTIGEIVIEYTIDLAASKYSTLGAVELAFRDFSEPNTNFAILGFDYSELASGINLIDENSIPRIAATGNDADTKMSLVMRTGSTGWLVNGKTIFQSNTNNTISGTDMYVGENIASVPSLQFYLYHSKNISTAGNLGTVRIVMQAITKVDDLTNKTERLIVNVNMTRVLYNTHNYEASITSGREYSMFASTTVDITSKSSISAYFSMYEEGETFYKTGYHRALVSNYVFPENTKITMIDLSETTPKYYYHNITSSDVANANAEMSLHSEVAYNFSMLEVMGAVNSGVYYDDAAMNAIYYDSTNERTNEEFIFIIDFKDTEINQDELDNTISIELRDDDDQTIINVIGIAYSNMIYDIYANGSAIIDIDGTVDNNTLYVGEKITVDVTTNYSQTLLNGVTVYDTEFFDSKMGIKVSLIDSDGNTVTGTSLMGLTYTINGIEYHPNIDGTTRIKIAEKVGNTKIWFNVDTKNSSIATGNYNLRIESFGSADGIYFGLVSSDYVDIPLYIINEIYGLDVTTDMPSIVVDSETGMTLNSTNQITYTIDYNSGLDNPSIRMKLYRRNYDLIYDTSYTLVNLSDYVSNSLFVTEVENEYLLIDNPTTSTTFSLLFNNNLTTGTYKLEFILYDDTTAIGSIDKYIIIK